LGLAASRVVRKGDFESSAREPRCADTGAPPRSRSAMRTVHGAAGAPPWDRVQRAAAGGREKPRYASFAAVELPTRSRKHRAGNHPHRHAPRDGRIVRASAPVRAPRSRICASGAENCVPSPRAAAVGEPAALPHRRRCSSSRSTARAHRRARAAERARSARLRARECRCASRPRSDGARCGGHSPLAAADEVTAAHPAVCRRGASRAHAWHDTHEDDHARAGRRIRTAPLWLQAPAPREVSGGSLLSLCLHNLSAEKGEKPAAERKIALSRR